MYTMKKSSETGYANWKPGIVVYDLTYDEMEAFHKICKVFTRQEGTAMYVLMPDEETLIKLLDAARAYVPEMKRQQDEFDKRAEQGRIEARKLERGEY